MTISHKSQYALVTAAILTASVIQLFRGYRPFVVILGALVFLVVGNATVYVSGTAERNRRRKAKRDYYEGL